MTPDPTASAVLAALTLCERLADAHPGAPIRIATAHGAVCEPTVCGRGVVTLHVDSLGVLVVAEIKGATRPLSQCAVPFAGEGADASMTYVERIGSREYRAVLGADLESALLTIRERQAVA